MSHRIGACCDTGHWPRSALYAIECLRILKGRIISFHFKDVNEYGMGAHDVPWGTGINDVKGMLTEVHRQGVKAVFSVEYEYYSENLLPESLRVWPISIRSRANLRASCMSPLAPRL